jgi:adenylate kinase family enzyme
MVYLRQSKPLVDYYSARDTFRAINGNQSADVVTTAVECAVNEAAAAGGVTS